MTKAQEAKNQAVEAVSHAKSTLINILSRLDNTKGTATASKELGSIIGRLEHWQWKHRK